MIYLDSAAVVKLVREEDETPALVTWLNERAGQRLVASALVEVEVPRALRRSQPEVLGAVAATLARIDRVELDAAIRATAAAYVDPHLRSLDAVHLATADQLVASGKDVSAFVTYDKRLAEAARTASLTVVAPGVGG
ncbi:type II toxin-antitoxin system VapC family toxin [Pseudonocardia sp. NPDC049635]|uniref:type II toxin-antitoxin system VapC family toxin n=1 Tax=Pseudonocardia sp. NPDC049635 TaxID=3155506 RepID=UPI003405821E